MGFRENLKSQLEYSGMPVKELAARSGVKKKTIDSYLAARNYTPSAEAALSIAKALGVTFEYLLTGTGDMKDRPLSSLHGDIQEIAAACEPLNRKERHIILTLARMFRDK